MTNQNKQIKAIALCRVSSDEQLKNHSLDRQNESVRNAAKKLGVVIPPEYIWSGSMSSKRGTNVNRKDLKAMLECCKRDKSIEYLIVDEPDRFMRSIDEAFYFEVQFQQSGVQVYYTNEELNGNNMYNKMLRFMKYFQAEGSNEERIKKSISGHMSALRAGRYPYQPLRGYKKGSVSGVPEKDGKKAEILQIVLKRLAAGTITLTESLKQYNELGPTAYSHFKPVTIDRWKKLVVNPFYAGVVQIDKQVQFRNEHGLHEPLITMEEHEKIREIIEDRNRNKVHNGPRKNGNPKYPLGKLIQHKNCPHTHTRYNKFVGLNQSSGKAKGRIYEKYRCRGCYLSFPKEAIEQALSDICAGIEMTNEGRKAFERALDEVWKREGKDIESQRQGLNKQINDMERKKTEIMDAYIAEDDKDMKADLKSRIEKNREIITSMKNRLKQLATDSRNEKNDFVCFALAFVDNLGTNFVKLSPEDAEKCKQIIFPDGFWIDDEKNVYTRALSPIYGYRNQKNPAKNAENHLWCG